MQNFYYLPVMLSRDYCKNKELEGKMSAKNPEKKRKNGVLRYSVFALKRRCRKKETIDTPTSPTDAIVGRMPESGTKRNTPTSVFHKIIKTNNAASKTPVISVVPIRPPAAPKASITPANIQSPDKWQTL